MPVMLERWNDDRMDALEAKVDDLAEGLREHRQESRELRQEMRTGFTRIDGRFERVDGRFERMQRTMLAAAIAISSSFITGFAAAIVLIATQL